ncbi:type II secretion system protein [Marinobacter sp. C2H3]|uniref:type II secretion system protein n=1 Tax=Marinobacter sp. C2H3 TaxID=3119003 RepID=UPI00300F79B9
MKTMNAVQVNSEKGFTLIELVMVIVILGILAAFALPRFADLGGDARVASLDGAIGAVKSAAGIAHSRYIADGDNPATVTLDGVTVDMENTNNGYPAATTGGIGAAAQLDANDFAIGTAAANVVTITLADSVTVDRDSDGTAGECSFDYSAVTGTVTNRSTDDC